MYKQRNEKKPTLWSIGKLILFNLQLKFEKSISLFQLFFDLGILNSYQYVLIVIFALQNNRYPQ